MKPRFKVQTAPRIGSGFYIRYDEPEREDDGQGAIVGATEVLHYCPTLQHARMLARKLLRRGIASVTVLQPLEYHRTIDPA